MQWYRSQPQNNVKVKAQWYKWYDRNFINYHQRKKQTTMSDAYKRRVRQYRKNRYHSDINFRLACCLRSSIRRAIKGNVTTFTYLGCSIEEFKKYLESKFQPGMSWDNYGEWHIDHIVPVASGKDIYKLFHYSNLQPLWARDNLRKGKKYA